MNSRFLWLCGALAALLMCLTPSAVRAESCPNDEVNAMPTISFPDAARGVKYDPFVGVNRAYSCDERLTFWQGKGIDAVFAIVHHRSGQVMFPMKDVSLDVTYRHVYPRIALGGNGDHLRDLIEGARQRGMYLSLGFWMFRDDSAYTLHPSWRQKLHDGSDGPETLLCARSPYMDREFYPMISHLYAQYGVKDYFLQEMWLEGDAVTGGRACYCDQCVADFNARYGLSLDREALVRAVKNDVVTRGRWVAFHYETLKSVVCRIEALAPGGTVLWHNPSPASEWASLKADAAFRAAHRISDMSLFPDEQIFVRGNTNVIDAYLEYAHVRRYVSLFGGEGMTLEFLSLYGMPGISRRVTRADILHCYLAALAAGMPGFIIEQDKMIDWAEERGGVGIWDALGECYKVIHPLFAGAVYRGDLPGAPVDVRGEGVYGGWWTAQNGDALVIVGAKDGGFATVRATGGQPFDWQTGAPLPDEAAVEPCSVQLWIVKPNQ